MTTLIAVTSNSTQLKSIRAFDNKKELLYTVWADSMVTVNNKDLYLEEVKQTVVIAKNFELFYNNIKMRT